MSHFKSFNVAQLKEIIRNYNLHHIKVKQKKEELIKQLEEHLEVVNGLIMLKKVKLDIQLPEKKEKEKKEKKEKKSPKKASPKKKSPKKASPKKASPKKASPKKETSLKVDKENPKDKFINFINKYKELIINNSSKIFNDKELQNAIQELYKLKSLSKIDDEMIEKWCKKYDICYKSSRTGSKSNEYINKRKKEDLEHTKKVFFLNKMPENKKVDKEINKKVDHIIVMMKENKEKNKKLQDEVEKEIKKMPEKKQLLLLDDLKKVDCSHLVVKPLHGTEKERRRQYIAQSILLHPDKNPKECEKEATKAFQKLKNVFDGDEVLGKNRKGIKKNEVIERINKVVERMVEQNKVFKSISERKKVTKNKEHHKLIKLIEEIRGFHDRYPEFKLKDMIEKHIADILK